jgi:hypothetical protein
MNKFFEILMYVFSILFIVGLLLLVTATIWNAPVLYQKIFGNVAAGGFLLFWPAWGGAMATLYK